MSRRTKPIAVTVALVAVAVIAVTAFVLTPVPATVSRLRPMTPTERANLPQPFAAVMTNFYHTDIEPYQVTNSLYSPGDLFNLRLTLLSWGLRPAHFSIEADSKTILVELHNGGFLETERRNNRWHFSTGQVQYADEKTAEKAEGGFFWQRFVSKAMYQ